MKLTWAALQLTVGALGQTTFYMKIALVNSRKPRRFRPDEPWLRWTMALGHAIARCGHTLCASVGTIGYESALFGAAMGDGNLEAFVTKGTEQDVADCLPRKASANVVSVRILPEGAANAEVERDRAIMDVADIVIAVAVRAGGHMESLLRARLEAGRRLEVVFPCDDGPHFRGNRKLLELGAPPVDEHLLQVAREYLDSRPIEEHTLDWGSFFPEWRTSPLARPTLAHFTRSADGPWPGQARWEYLEDLWHGGLRARRDGAAALWRILQSSTLKASSRLIRGRHPVVSFTAVSPERIGELYRYRPHLIRWDFEPFGVVFDRDWLAKRNVHPVKYLPEASFRTLSPDEKPWFQKHEPPGCDYTMEEEWRHLGDLDFSDAPRDAVRIITGAGAVDART